MAGYQDKVAIVTGGAGGIGSALCRALADRGAAAVVADIDKLAADRLASTIDLRGGRAEGRHVDVRSEAEVQCLIDETVEQHGRVDYMFNAAGVAVIGELRDMTAEHWRPILEITLGGVVNGTMCAYRTMIGQGFGQHRVKLRD
jgi:NAD(P)-dependent dehydrogenase (short-subunit alcohol dehydrogenase family)